MGSDRSARKRTPGKRQLIREEDRCSTQLAATIIGPVRTLSDVVASDRELAGTVYLGLVAHGIYITPYHLGFTNASQDSSHIEEVLAICRTVLSRMSAD